MARKRESFLKRIARNTGHTEESLQEFLRTESDKQLIWTGKFRPKAPHKRVQRRSLGLPYEVWLYPRPALGDACPARLLFCHHHDLESLDPAVVLKNTCKTPSCISPFHRLPKPTFSRRWERFPEMPQLKVSQLTGIIEYLAANEDSFRGRPELLGHFPKALVEEAFRRLGWSTDS